MLKAQASRISPAKLDMLLDRTGKLAPEGLEEACDALNADFCLRVGVLFSQVRASRIWTSGQAQETRVAIPPPHDSS